jgi:uncharacterized protein DUF3829
MIKRLGLTVAVLVCAVLLGACKMVEQLKKTGEAAKAAASAAAEQAAGPSSEEEKDGQLSEKLEGYIYCMNYETRSVYRLKDSYLRDIDEAKGPTGKERNVYVNNLSADACLKRIDEAKKKPPALPDLEAAAAGYQSSLASLDKLSQTAHDYYDHKDFKDDKFAKGIAMHKPLMDALGAFEKADKVFEDKVTTLNDGVQQRRLVRLQKDPKAQLEYRIAKSIDDAKKLVHFAEVDSLAKLDANGYNAALAAYEATYNDMTSYIQDHKADADKVVSLSFFTNASSYYLKAAKELMRRKRDNKDFAKESGSPENVDGHPAQVLAKYNDMINHSNGLRFRQ